MERLNIHEAFTKLKPCCDSLMKDPNVKNAMEIAIHIKDISSAVLQDLLEYILFPIIVHLQNDQLSKDVKRRLVESTRALILKTRITKLNYFNKLYACLLYQVYEKNQPSMVIPHNEELKEAVVLCIRDLLQRCTTDIIELIYVRDNAPKLGQGVYLCISIARTEKLRSLRLAAIETVMILSQVHDEVDSRDIVLRAQAADVVMLFLPGIASGLQEVALGSDIQGHKITMMAIRAWGRIVALVMEDKSELDPIPSLDSLCKKNITVSLDPLGSSLRSEGAIGMKKLMQTATRSREWFDAAASKLNVLMQALIELTKHSHFKVRKELAENVGLLLVVCTRNMKPNFTELAEILISLSEDDNEEVSEVARKALEQVNAKCTQENSLRPLIELLEENFYKLLTELPRIVRMSDDSTQLSYLNRLVGYLRLLGKQRLPQVMAFAAHLQRLLLALVYIVELDCRDISLLEDVTIKNLDDKVNYISRPWKEFKFIHELSIELKLRIICKLLGEFGDLGMLVDGILGLMSDFPQYKKELTLILNWILEVPVNDTTNLSLYKSIVDCYTERDLWYLPIVVSKDITLREAQNNVVQCCLLIEGLGVIAQVLQHEYQRFLLKTLYLVVERAGSGHGVISLVGFCTLERFTKAMEHDAITDLLQANFDYLSYHVTMKLRWVERNPGVLDAVAVVMNYSTMDVLPCLREIIEDVLLQSNAIFHERNSYSFLKVFYTFAVCIRKLISKTPDTFEQKQPMVQDRAETVIQTLLEYFEAKKMSERLENDESESKLDDVTNLEENIDEIQQNYGLFQDAKKPDPPSYLKMIEEVTKRCIHYLPCKELAKVLIAMDTLREGLLILVEWEDQLLPIVHQLWHPLVDRFRDSNPLVINRAWHLLYTLANVSKDFIRSRTLKQVLPAISEFLNRATKESYKKDSGNAYKFTQTYKLQKELLSQLGATAGHLKLRERELWKLLEIAEPYLSAHQHPVLQECCVTLYKDIADHNSDIAWTKCLSIWNSNSTIVLSDTNFELAQMKVANSNIQNEYQKNVEIIITYIQDKTIGV